MDKNDNNHHIQHEGQWERQGEWLEKLRLYKKDLASQGVVQGWDLMEAMSTLCLDHKISVSNHRCSDCWHDQNNCICSDLNLTQQLPQLPNVKIMILMHHKEYLCAGNSAKLLLQLLPNHTELYIFGKHGEVDRLFQNISLKEGDYDNTMILWPDKDALTVSEFLQQLPADNKDTKVDDPPREEASSLLKQQLQPPLMRAIVLDGTYTQARNMHRSLRKRLGRELPLAVQLRPTTGSIFHRAQKNYGKAHQQQKLKQNQTASNINSDGTSSQAKPSAPIATRISTAEACGLLLTELGADPSMQERIVKAVVTNNEALGYARNRKTRAPEEAPTKEGDPKTTEKAPIKGGDPISPPDE